MRNRELFAVLAGEKQPDQGVLIVREAIIRFQGFPSSFFPEKALILPES